MGRTRKHDLLPPAASQAVGDALRSPSHGLFPRSLRNEQAPVPSTNRLPVTSAGDEVEQQAKQAEQNPTPHLNFANVRVHTGPEAEKTAAAVGARAFTVGNHMVFGRGQYQPHRDEGRKLLAHELAHAKQPGSERRLARASVEGVENTGISVDRSNIETAAKDDYWSTRIDDSFGPMTTVNDTQKRFTADPEERDAVLSSIWQQKPKGKVASKTTVNLVIDPRANAAKSKKLLYQAIFSPPAKGVDKSGSLEVQFLQEDAAANSVTPAPPSSFSPGMTISDPPEVASQLKAHPEENKQLIFWLQNAPATFGQLVKTQETGIAGKVHESFFSVSGKKGRDGSISSFQVTLLGESAPALQNPPPGYDKKDKEDFNLEKLQDKKDDKLGQITGLNGLPADEQLSVKYVINQYFTGGAGGKKTRNKEVDVNVPIANTKKNVLYTLRFQPNNDVEVSRVGEPNSKPELMATGLNITRVEGFAAHSTDAAFEPWVKARYPSVKVDGNTLPEKQESVNKDMVANAGAPAWFSGNYGIQVLDDKAGATRLHDVHHRETVQTAGMMTFQPDELKSLEFALETMSDAELKLLRDIRFARQQVLLEFHGTGKTRTLTPATSTSGETFQNGSDRTIVIYNNATVNDKTLFLGGTRGVREESVATYAHEFGHALGSQNNLESSFKAFVKSKKIKPITNYAKENVSKGDTESFPEAFAFYQNDPEWMQNNLPDLFNWFEAVKKTGSPP